MTVRADESTQAGHPGPARQRRSVNVLVADDDPAVGQLITTYLQRIGCQTRTFTDSRACLAEVKHAPPDIVITDLYMPDLDGLALLREVKQRSPSTDVIVVTGGADKDAAIQALRLGAFDFFEKPFSGEELTETITRTVRYRTAVAERDRFEAQLSFVSAREAERWGIEAFVGKSEAIQKLLHDVRLLQGSGGTSVLITGESGTGKELVARAVHFGSPRASRPFIPVNCSAIPAELAESTLFGHVKGAFTGATADQKGCFELADEGTVFLDEICDMPLTLQCKLLRVLEDGIVTPVGLNTGRFVNVRVVAATNGDMKSRVEDGRFRADLFYRLAGFTLHLPPLRERPGDIALLARHFARTLAGEMGLSTPGFHRAALEVLQEYRFPGNVRELKNMIERALITCGGQEVRAEHLLFLDVGSGRPRPPASSAPASGSPASAAAVDGPLNLREAERAAVRRAMQTAGGNVSEAARLLGITRSKLHRKLALL